MKIKSYVPALVCILITLIGVIVSAQTGLWQTESNKIPQRFESAELNGQYKPADIRGSYTFGEISSLYKIPLADLAAAFGVSTAQASSFKCKDLETLYSKTDFDLGTSAVRFFVAAYLGLPYETSEAIAVTQKGAEILKTKGKPLLSQLEIIQKNTVNLPK